MKTEDLDEPGDVSGPCTVPRPMERPRVYNPPVGTHIDHACKEAAALAINSGREVAFKFNDIALVATPSTSWKELSKRFNDECQRRSEEYRNSPEGKTAAAKRAAEVKTQQATITRLVGILPATLQSGLDATVIWVKQFAPPSDDIAVQFDKVAVATEFEEAGYIQNEHVGRQPNWFNTRERTGRYLIGQVINCLLNGMPPHPRSIYFCDKYFQLPKAP